jgi:hypothetical protein
MRVYRVENVDGNGPYALGDIGLATKWTDRTQSPPPNKDEKLGPKWDKIANTEPWKFGFRTIESFAEWFSYRDDIDILRNKGFVLNEYEVPSVHTRTGNTQLVFRKEKATLTRSNVLNWGQTTLLDKFKAIAQSLF